MFSCVTSLAASLLYLAPVIVMIGFVLYVKLRGTDDEPEPAPMAHELEPVV
jgi:hypothetical protein